MNLRIGTHFISTGMCLRAGLLALLAVGAVFGLTACTGSGTATNTTIQGIWTGTSASTVGGPSSTGTFEFFQSGTTITGTHRTIVQGNNLIGSITGTVNGTSIHAVRNIAGVGTIVSDGTINGTTITGTYVYTPLTGPADSGTFTLSKTVGLTTPNISGNFNGTSTQSGSVAKPLSFVITQTQDTLTITGTSNSTNQFSGTGTIIGNDLIAHLVHTGTTDVTDITGTVSGTTISGATTEPGTNAGNNGVAKSGTFTVTKGI